MVQVIVLWQFIESNLTETLLNCFSVYILPSDDQLPLFTVMTQIPSTAPPLRVILPKSLSTTSSSQPESSLRCDLLNTWKCDNCPRTFKTDRGRNQHQNKCRTSSSSSVVRIQPNVEVQQPQPLVLGRIPWRTLNSSSMQRTMKLSIGEKTFSCCLQVRQENCIFVRPLDYLRCGQSSRSWVKLHGKQLWSCRHSFCRNRVTIQRQETILTA